jgi:RecJ-like exonuclease
LKLIYIISQISLKMNESVKKLDLLKSDLEKARVFFLEKTNNLTSSVHIYTHIDADGLSAGAILGKALYRAKIPFQISILRQLEKEEILKIAHNIDDSNKILIFSDFGSGQYLELKEKLSFNGELFPFLILDHHLPQKVPNKEERDLIEDIHKETNPWHINPYFYGIDGSTEVSGAGMCYYFTKVLSESNINLSSIALIGGTGDIQNQGANKSFLGINKLILKDAVNVGFIEVVDDLNLSPIKPLNEALAYSTELNLPGLTKDVNRSLLFLQSLGILMEDSEGSIRSLSDLNQDEKQKVSTAIIEYGTLKLDIEPSEIIEKLIVNRYVLKNEVIGSELYDTSEFSRLLNACGRTDVGSLGIAIAMGDRKDSYQQAKDVLANYKKLITKSLSWIKDEDKLQHKEYIQYYYGEDIIPENIIGTITSMLVFDTSGRIEKQKPIFGLAKRVNENVYKVSGRAHESIVNKGVNLSEAIREACRLSSLDVLGGGHPPAAGTKIPVEKIELFLEKCNEVIRDQLD